MTCLLGIDSGLTVTKAVVFDARGRVLSVARRRLAQDQPQPRHVERDMGVLWQATAEAIREAVATCGRPASTIAAVAPTAHGDGLFVLDRDGAPLGPGILSLDSRAGGEVERWRAAGLFPAMLERTGQAPHASAPSALLAWIARHEPARFARIGHVLAAKDWLRFCLTGIIATDRTEASTAFTDVSTQAFSPEALRLYGLDALAHALPPVSGPAAIAGRVTPEAAAMTGLVAGTPVAAGLHDVTASALGIGGHVDGVVGIVAGTYSINEVVSDVPRVDTRWMCRSAVMPGRWNAMAISPASSANYDWFTERLVQPGGASGPALHAQLAGEIAPLFDAPPSLLFHPWLFGSPQGPGPGASFIGLRGWHGRPEMLAAVIEGIAFNHREHVDALADFFAFREARLTGGVSRNPQVAQLFADVLGLPVTVTQTEEAAAWGAAMCAGAAVRLFASPLDDPRDLAALSTVHHPDPGRQAMRAARYDLWRRAADALNPLWPDLDAAGMHS